MTLQERLVALAPYNAGFNIYDNQFVVNVTYADGWVVVDPDKDSDVILTKDLSNQNLYYYIAPMSVPFDDIFELVDLTINYNIELQEKVVFFKEKVGELKELFTNEDLETLKTLEFKLKKKKSPQSKKRERKESKIKETASVTTEDNSDIVLVANNNKTNNTEDAAI
jgi:hypothetical protein